jgi:hypothetical protein
MNPEQSKQAGSHVIASAVVAALAEVSPLQFQQLATIPVSKF